MHSLGTRLVLFALVLVGSLFALNQPVTALAVDSPTVGWALSPANGPLGNDRPNYNYLTAPGAVITDGVVIQSRSSKPLTLRVYAADAYTTADGLLDLQPAASPAEDAGAWVSFGNPATVDTAASTVSPPSDWLGQTDVTITLEPSTAVTVPLRWTVPSDATAGDHSAGIVTSLVESAESSAAVQVDRRLALRAYLNVDGQATAGITISNLQVQAEQPTNPLRSGTLKVTYSLHNSGSLRLVPTEYLETSGPAGLGKQVVAADQVLPEILPGSTLVRTANVSGVIPLFRTTVKVSVSALAIGLGAEGESVSTAGSLTIWTVPWLWTGLLVLLVAAAVVWPFWRTRRTQKAKNTASDDKLLVSHPEA
ncbi:MAG: DUF916 domain-containing protein [Bifidobacteriaceae bacterium]|jgi:hypothetical protein|nr:DUF916 domain-containing protein [Bifidobacteriaceae bacterium]